MVARVDRVFPQPPAKNWLIMRAFRSMLPRLQLAGLVLAGFALCGNLTAQSPPDTEDIRGPKPMLEIPVPKKPPYALYVGIGSSVFALILAAMLINYYRGKQRAKTPREIALASLREIEARHQSDTAEAFAYRSAKTVRDYLAARFGLAAPRRTTEEFLNDLVAGNHPLLATHGNHLQAFLKSCDLAKFAGTQLDDNQRAELVESARSLVYASTETTEAAR